MESNGLFGPTRWRCFFSRVDCSPLWGPSDGCGEEILFRKSSKLYFGTAQRFGDTEEGELIYLDSLP